MAITNAIIQSRRGDEANFDPDQMRPGEWAVSLDTRYVRMCFAPGICVRMATYEGFEEDMQEIQLILATCQDIQTAVEKFETLAKQHANTAEEYSLESKSWAVGGTGTRDGEDTNNSKYHSEQAKNEADRAKAEADRAAGIAGIDVGKVGTPGIVAPDGKMIDIDAQGNISTIYKNYRALNQIGLDDYSDYTCLEIVTAMPDNSRIVLCPSDNVAPITDIPGVKGLLIIERRNTYNATAIWYSSPTIRESWSKILQVQNQKDSGWDKDLRSSQLVSNLLATEAGNPLDATMGKVLKDEVDSLNNVFAHSMDLLNKKLTDTDYISVVKGDKFAAGGALYCWVRNGFACITMEVTPKEAVANGDIVLYSLPKPRTNIYCTLGGTQGNYNARINADTGNLVIYYPRFTEVMRIDTFIVYPVA